MIEKIKSVVLPSLLAVGIGVLAIKYPGAMQDIEAPNHASSWEAALVLLILWLLLKFTWGKIGGIVAIVLGLLWSVVCLCSNQEQAVESLSIDSKKD